MMEQNQNSIEKEISLLFEAVNCFEKSIAAISQPHNLNEYKYKSYEEFSKEFQEVYPAAARAFALIPQIYNRLTLVDGLTHKHALRMPLATWDR